MAKITKEELLKLAHMSQIYVNSQDIDKLTEKLDAVLSYASRLIAVAQNKAITPLPQNSNITREDIVISTDPEPLIALSPDREGNYYSVPRILKTAESVHE